MDTIEVLEKARELISDPERWCKYDGALDANCEWTMPEAEEAVVWCASGAIRKFTGTYDDCREWIECWTPINNTCLELHGERLTDFNDAWSTKHPDILHVFDVTIDRLKKAS